MLRLSLLLTLAACLAACDAALSPYEDSDDGLGSSVQDRMVGTWAYPDYAFDGTDDVYYQIASGGFSALEATRWRHYAGAGCREATDYSFRYSPLTDSTFAESYVSAGGQPSGNQTVRVQVSDAQLRFSGAYLNPDGTTFPFQNSLTKASAATFGAVPRCPFNLMGTYEAGDADGAALPRTYTATDAAGVARTYRLSEAYLTVEVDGVYLTLRQAIVTGNTAGAVVQTDSYGAYVVTAGGAWSADPAEPLLPGLRLSATSSANSNVQTVRFQRTGMATPITFRFFEYNRPAAAPPEALRRPRPDPAAL